MESNDIGNKPVPETGMRLILESSSGGFLHNGSDSLCFLKNPLDVPSSVKKGTEGTTASSTTYSTLPAAEHSNISTMSDHKRSTRTPYLNSESDSDGSEEEEFLQKRPGHKHEIYTLCSVHEVKTKSSLGASK